MALRTDYKDFILDASMQGKQRFKLTQRDNGTYNIDDVSEYEQEGDVITASMLNGICLVANQLTEELGVAKRSAREATASAQAAAISETNTHNDTVTTQNNTQAVTDMKNEVAANTQSVSDMKDSVEISEGNARDSENMAEQYRDQAKAYAENAEAITGISTMTYGRNGIGKPNGDTLDLDISGTFNVKTMTNSVKGVGKPNTETLDIENGVFNVKKMSSNTYGVGKVDDETIVVDENSVLTAIDLHITDDTWDDIVELLS